MLGAHSKGMRRKVVITAALSHNPPVVFFAEPLDSLDGERLRSFFRHKSEGPWAARQATVTVGS